MLSIYLQRTSSGQLAAQPRLEASASLGQSSASTGPPGPSAEPSPRLLGAQSQRQETAPSPFNVPFQREGASTGGTPSFFPSTSSIPISQRSSSQQALSQSSTDLPPGGQASRYAHFFALALPDTSLLALPATCTCSHSPNLPIHLPDRELPRLLL